MILIIVFTVGQCGNNLVVFRISIYVMTIMIIVPHRGNNKHDKNNINHNSNRCNVIYYNHEDYNGNNDKDYITTFIDKMIFMLIIRNSE